MSPSLDNKRCDLEISKNNRAFCLRNYISTVSYKHSLIMSMFHFSFMTMNCFVSFSIFREMKWYNTHFNPTRFYIYIRGRLVSKFEFQEFIIPLDLNCLNIINTRQHGPCDARALFTIKNHQFCKGYAYLVIICVILIGGTGLNKRS